MRSTGCFPRRRHADPVLQFEDHSLRRFFPNAADLRKRRDIVVDHGSFEIVNAHSAQHRQCQFRPDAADVIDEQPKEIALRCRHESIENLSILAHVQMGENFNRLTNCRKFVIARERNENLVADPADVDRRLRRQRMRESAMKKSDHFRNP